MQRKLLGKILKNTHIALFFTTALILTAIILSAIYIDSNIKFVNIGIGIVAIIVSCFFIIKMAYAKIRAEESNKNKSTFLTKMSGEIRGPISSIIAYGDGIARDTHISEDTRKYAANIKNAGANLLAIVNDILDFSKLDSGNFKTRKIPYMMTSVINDVINIIRSKISDKNIVFTVNVDCKLPNYLIGDEIRIRQVMLNLLSNAVEYMDNGYVSFALTGEIQNEKEVAFLIKITDTCSDSNIDTALTHDLESSNLGLVLTKRLCLSMGGDIELQNGVNGKTVVTAKVIQQFSEYLEIAKVEKTENKNILIFESDAVYLQSIKDSLLNLGIKFDIAEYRNDAETKLKNNLYQYAFVSSHQYAFINAINKDINKKCRIVSLTGLNEEVKQKNIMSLKMPANIISITNILNDKSDDGESKSNFGDFTAPEARVLVVDDILVNLMLAESLLSAYEITVDTCESGKDALRLVKEYRYDLILMDHMMPEMDGIETTKAIRALKSPDDYYKNLPIIAFTANALSGTEDMYYENGMNDFIAKPVENSKFNKILKKWIPLKKQRYE